VRLLNISQRVNKIRAFVLVAPLLVFLVIVLFVPVAMLLSRSVLDSEVVSALPRTVVALSNWDPRTDEVPSSAVFSALFEDLKSPVAPDHLAQAAARLNYALPGMRALLLSTSRNVANAPAQDARAVLIAASPKWNKVATWAVIRQASGPLTDFYILASLDLQRNPAGAIVGVGSAFARAIVRTFEISLSVTILALAVGFPFAYIVAQSSPRVSALLIFVVLLPFWTAIMVRTLSWMVLLQREGLVNRALIKLGAIDTPLNLLFNRFAVLVALLHIFVPYMVLPLYGVMKTVSRDHLRAAAMLGARPSVAFLRIYLPQVGPGIGAGCLLVFIQCLGVFVVPTLLGGPGDQGIPNLIAFYVNKTLNWGMAASLSIVLLLSVYLCYWLFAKLTRSASLNVS
jgi:putative spermidine/putrescine transport system permease protein